VADPEQVPLQIEGQANSENDENAKPRGSEVELNNMSGEEDQDGKIAKAEGPIEGEEPSRPLNTAPNSSDQNQVVRRTNDPSLINSATS